MFGTLNRSCLFYPFQPKQAPTIPCDVTLTSYMSKKWGKMIFSGCVIHFCFVLFCSWVTPTSLFTHFWTTTLPRAGGGGHSLKICDGYVRPHWPPFSNRLSLNDPLIHFALTYDPHFQILSTSMTPFFRKIYRWKWVSCSHWMTPIFTNKWPPRNMYPIFVWKEGFM